MRIVAQALCTCSSMASAGRCRGCTRKQTMESQSEYSTRRYRLLALLIYLYRCRTHTQTETDIHDGNSILFHSCKWLCVESQYMIYKFLASYDVKSFYDWMESCVFFYSFARGINMKRKIIYIYIMGLLLNQTFIIHCSLLMTFNAIYVNGREYTQ